MKLRKGYILISDIKFKKKAHKEKFIDGYSHIEQIKDILRMYYPKTLICHYCGDVCEGDIHVMGGEKYRIKLELHHKVHRDNHCISAIAWACLYCHKALESTGTNKKKKSVRWTSDAADNAVKLYVELGSIRRTLKKLGYGQRNTRLDRKLSQELRRRGYPIKLNSNLIDDIHGLSDEGKEVLRIWTQARSKPFKLMSQQGEIKHDFF